MHILWSRERGGEGGRREGRGGQGGLGYGNGTERGAELLTWNGNYEGSLDKLV